MNKSADRDMFEIWLMDMSDAIDRFRGGLPERISNVLDLSPESLPILEGLLLERYPNIAAVRPMTEAKFADGAARYVGQVFRRSQGGKWDIDFSDPKNADHARPQLVGMRGQVTQISPLSLVTASLDRRTGSYILGVLKSLQARSRG